MPSDDTHGNPLFRYSDAARRCSDEIALHLSVDFDHAVNSWIAIRLSDGGSDGVLYDSKAAAIRHQLHETQCAYVQIPPTGMTPRQAENFLSFNRQLYDAGMRIRDPEQPEISAPERMEEWTRHGLKPPRRR